MATPNADPDREVPQVQGRELIVSHPGKLLFPEAGVTKRDLVQHYLAVAPGALRGAGGRPCVLKRFPDGVGGEAFFQKRVPSARPDWIEVATIRFPSGRTAQEIVPRDAAALAWMANLGCLELHPHPVRAQDLDHPDELRVDLDPVPGVKWRQIVQVAMESREVLAGLGLQGWPKTSGSRGLHILVRIAPRWAYHEVRSAALALAREIERRVPKLATTAWWKDQRHGVFIDYNQNARDRTVASAYSVRPLPDARVSMPLRWDELAACNPADFTVKTASARFAALGDAHEGLDAVAPGDIAPLLELAARQAREGAEDAPWPPYHRKPHRAAPAGQPPVRQADAPAGKAAGAAPGTGSRPRGRKPGPGAAG